MDDFRRAQLEWLWDSEDDSEDSVAYREDLTEEEREYIDSLDRAYNAGISALCRDILAMDRKLSMDATTHLEQLRPHDCRPSH